MDGSAPLRIALLSALGLFLADGGSSGLAQEEEKIPAGFTVVESTRWEAPTRKITNLDEFFSTIPETTMGRSWVRRMAFGVVHAVKSDGEDRTLATFKLEILPDAPPVPSRSKVSLSLPLQDMGQPFVVGQAWTLYFDEGGRIVHLQTEGIVTHYRRRKDGFVQVRLRDGEGRFVEVLPTTLMPPESVMEDGFFSYLGLFREAGLVLGYDAVGGPSSLELESISLPALEGRRDGLFPDPSPWKGVTDGGMGDLIPKAQRFAY